jgi:hypothetical protein
MMITGDVVDNKDEQLVATELIGGQGGGVWMQWRRSLVAVGEGDGRAAVLVFFFLPNLFYPNKKSVPT